jgi:hypothetical protein
VSRSTLNAIVKRASVERFPLDLIEAITAERFCFVKQSVIFQNTHPMQDQYTRHVRWLAMNNLRTKDNNIGLPSGVAAGER